MKIEGSYKKTMRFLVEKLYYKHSAALKIVYLYGEEIGCSDRHEICDAIQNDWQLFLDFYGTIKDEFKIMENKHNENGKNKEYHLTSPTQ